MPKSKLPLKKKAPVKKKSVQSQAKVVLAHKQKPVLYFTPTLLTVSQQKTFSAKYDLVPEVPSEKTVKSAVGVILTASSNKAAGKLHGKHIRVLIIGPTKQVNVKNPSVYGYLTQNISTDLLLWWVDQAFGDLRQASKFEIIEKRSRDQEQIIDNLLKVGVQLSSERDIEKLLKSILLEAIKLTSADSGSVALLGYGAELQKLEEKKLTFFINENTSKQLDFTRSTITVDEKSLSGYAVLSKEILNIPDAYQIPANKPYSFNQGFDVKNGFRTKSMVIVPMKNASGKVLGILSLLNKKKELKQILNYDKFDSNQVFPFDLRDTRFLNSFTSLATVALENALLLKEIEDLFANFVNATVSSIEARDPTTSGHSFRVTEYTLRLAHAVNESNDPIFKGRKFSAAELRELEYAGLLHDFGKVAVRESVLLKAKKLTPERMAMVSHRFEILHYQTLLEMEKMKLTLLKENGSDPLLAQRLTEIEANGQAKIDKLLKDLALITQANEPSVLAQETGSLLKELNGRSYVSPQGEQRELLTAEEFTHLSIERGSLTKDERLQIESHVTHSYHFLNKITWISSLKDIPTIAYGHHEKLDGTGYPLGLTAKDLCIQTRMMTIADIYDALTASDRAYKKAMTTEKALSILQMEVDQGKLDKDLFKLFVDSKSYTLIDIDSRSPFKT